MPKVALVVALLIAGPLAAPDSIKERGAEKEMSSEGTGAVEAAQSADADAESVQETESDVINAFISKSLS